MPVTRNRTLATLPDDAPAAQQRRDAPKTPGVYHFYGQHGALLYVGKSVNLFERINSHYHAAVSDAKENRLMSQTWRIEWQETAGELGALLRENEQIKSLKPLYNRRQRKHRRLWTLTVQQAQPGWVVSVDSLSDETPPSDCFGLFTSKRQATGTLDKISREQGLCADVLDGKPVGKPCFARQLKRCRGACEGIEAIADHNQRLLTALSPLQIEHWPFDGPIVIEETGRVDAAADEWHLVHRWAYLGSVENPEVLSGHLHNTQAPLFDLDAYFLIRKAIADPNFNAFELTSSGSDPEAVQLTDIGPSRFSPSPAATYTSPGRRPNRRPGVGTPSASDRLR